MPSDYALSTEYVDRIKKIIRTGGEEKASGNFPTYGKKSWRYVRARRIRHLLAQWILVFLQEHESASSDCKIDFPAPVSALSNQTGVGTRVFSRIIGGESYWVSFNNVDKILTGLDMNYLWFYQPTNKFKSDGFADVYNSMREK